MAKEFCDKCGGPIDVENGKYVCLICGAKYGDAPALSAKKETRTDFTEFFENVSLEKFRRISNRLSSSIVANMLYSSNKDYPIYLLAALSNGQFYSRFTPAPSGFYDSIYRGQCAAEQWVGVEKIYGHQGYTIGIGYDGELFPTLIEHQQLFDRIKKTGVSNMRMRQVIELNYAHESKGYYDVTFEDSFLGLDINGKVVIHNPFKIFRLKKESAEDVTLCKELVRKIKSWPAVKSLKSFWSGNLYVGVTEDGKVFCESNGTSKEKAAEILRSWNSIDSVEVNSLENRLYGLKKDGTLVSTMAMPNNEALTDIVQIKLRANLLFLRRNGDLFYVGGGDVNKVAQNVVALFDGGYIGADGSIYEYTSTDGIRAKVVPGAKLFNSIETVEEEWAETIAAVKALKDAAKDEAKRIKEEEAQHQRILSEHQKKLDELQKERKSLGLFKRKEKDELDLKIAEMSENIRQEEQAIKKIRTSVSTRKIPDGKPIWSDQGDIKQLTEYDMKQISAAAHRAIGDGPKKDRSVIKDAAVGAVIAGPAGAIIGAIYAADKNQRNKK